MRDSDYTTIKAYREVRNEARRIKEQLDLSWNEFLRQAADELDPGSSD
jgi:hypothetical protein